MNTLARQRFIRLDKVCGQPSYTQNGRIVAEIRANVNANGAVTDRLEFIYDEAGQPVQMIHNGNTFNYVLNLQGDVQQIRCAWTGEVVATYMYNAFGEIWGAEGRMARINPLLYRGYFLCSSLGMYYLQSRYYDPWIGRFINADAFVSTGQGFLGMNMFAYCLNNPVMLTDHTGYMACACGSGRVCTQNTSHGINAPPPPPPFSPITAGQGPRAPITAGTAPWPDLTGPPNTTVPFPNDSGFRRYGPDGNLFQDWHSTDHGNSRRHPHVPHVHDPDDDGKPGPPGGRPPTEAERRQWGEWTGGLLPTIGEGLVIVGGIGVIAYGVVVFKKTGCTSTIQQGLGMVVR